MEDDVSYIESNLQLMQYESYLEKYILVVGGLNSPHMRAHNCYEKKN